MSLRRYLLRLGPHTAALLVATLLLMATASVPAAAVLLLRQALDRLLAADTRGLLPLVVAFVALQGLHAVGVVARTAVTKGVAFSVASSLRRELHAKWLAAAPSGATGDRLAALTDEVDQVQYGVSAAVTALRNPLALAGLLGVAATVAPMLVPLAVLLLLPVGMVAWWGGRRIRHLTAEGRRARASLFGLMHAQLTGAETVQAFGIGGAEGRRMARLDRADRKARLRLEVVRTIPSVAVQVLVAVALAALLSLGTTHIADQTLDPASLVAFVLALGLASRPLSGLSEVWSLLQRSLAALERVDRVLAEPPRVASPSDPEVLPPGPLVLAWHQVDYSVGSATLLDGVDVEAHPGQIVAIVGATGAGKTTLLRLAWRAMDPTLGRVTLGGIDLRDLADADLRRAVAVVPQDLFLFGRSMLDNIALVADPPDRVAAVAALVDARATFALARSGGLDAPLAEGGQGLSGGERQRLALARALYGGARVLLLDEPTSQVDPGTSTAMLQALRALGAHRTVVVVAHDPILANGADRVVRLEAGQVVAVGPPSDVFGETGSWTATWEE